MAKDKKNLALAIAKIEKDFGKGAVQKLSDKGVEDIEVISTGSLSLDTALGVGGLPKGRVVEIYGPESSGKTTLAIHVIAEAQKKGGSCAIVDAEHAFDSVYAEQLGVDVDELYISQPDYGEQALEIVDRLTQTGDLDVIVIDSVAALVPKGELEGEMGDSKMGLHARLMSQALRKLTATVSKTNTMLIFINQLREKIGVMFGCLDYDTRIVLKDGSTEKIGVLVNKVSKEGASFEVKTFDVEGKCLIKPITSVFRNSETRVDGFLSFTVAKGRDNGRAQFRATPNHLISTPTGDVPAELLQVDDEVMVLQTKIVSQQSFEILLGGLYGDNHLKIKSTGFFNSIQCQHGLKQREYCKWKASLLGDLVRYDDVHNIWYSKPLLEFDRFNQRSEEWISQLTLLSVAIMYMDDGSYLNDRCFIYKKWSEDELTMLENQLFKLTGARASVNAKYGRLTYCTAQMRKFIDSIAKYVHPSMRYKVYSNCSILFEPLEYQRKEPEEILYPMPILDIKPSLKKSVKFDLEIADTHHYLADGVLVHNSPETTTGGNALKFYASVRLDIRRAAQIKDGDSVIGNRTKVKIVKNKVAPPFKVAEYDLMFGEGISKAGEIIDIGVQYGIIEKAGSWFSYNGDKLGQGKDAVKELLKDNPELMEEIENLIKEKING